jgi:hypothetical protein
MSGFFARMYLKLRGQGNHSPAGVFLPGQRPSRFCFSTPLRGHNTEHERFLSPAGFRIIFSGKLRRNSNLVVVFFLTVSFRKKDERKKERRYG